MNNSKILDIIVSAFNISFSITQIENVLGIVILCLQIAYICYRVGYNIYKNTKDKKYDKIGDDIFSLEQQLKLMLEKLAEKKNSTTDEIELKKLSEEISRVEKLLEENKDGNSSK